MKQKKITLKLFDIFALVTVLIGISIALMFVFQKQNYIRVTVKVAERDVLYNDRNSPSWFSHFFQKGMVEKDSSGRKVAEINDVYMYDSVNHESYFNTKTVLLDVTLKTNVNRKSGKYFFKGKPILIGSPLVIEFNNIAFQGLVTKTEFSPSLYEQKDVIVKSRIIKYRSDYPSSTGIMKHVVDSLHIGDKMIDINEEPIITILDKKVSPSKVETVDRYGNIQLRNDPILKDVFLTLKIQANKINDEFYIFDDMRIKIGNRIPVLLPQVNIWPEITELVDGFSD